MASVKVKVIGPFEVGGIAPGEEGTIDDEHLNMKVLLDARQVEVILTTGTTKADLQVQAEALGLSTEGTKAELADRIREAQGGEG